MGLDIYYHRCKSGQVDRYEQAHKEWAKQQPESSKKHCDDYETLPESEKESIKKEVKEWYEKEPSFKDYGIEDVGYFRKVNFLMPFFSYFDNCEFKVVSKEELEDLKERTDKLSAIKPYRRMRIWWKPENEGKIANPKEGEHYWVKKLYRKADKALAEDLLPTTSGFFYGSTEYDQYYWNDVKEVNEWVTNLLKETDFENEEVLMYCWW